MKAIEIRVDYGKAHKFIVSNWVAENAVEEFKAMWTNKIRNWGWDKDITFEIRRNTCEIDKKGKGEIWGYTINGYSTMKVK
jgi:hypothetical protein